MATFLELDWPVRMSLRLPIERLLECELLSYNPAHRFIRTVGESRHALVREVFTCCKRVKDVDRFRIARTADEWSLVKPDGSPQDDVFANCLPEPGFSGQTLVVLLDSPHRDEYGPGFTPSGPAMGTTGRNIRSGLVDAIRRSAAVSVRIADGMRVIIANPVQFQCSLYVIHRNRSVPSCRRRELRDAAWHSIWSVDETRSEFIERMQTYQPATILNLCTDSECKRAAVTQEICQAGFQDRVFVGPHPSWVGWVGQAQFGRPDCLSAG